jgi:hypothetical protein
MTIREQVEKIESRKDLVEFIGASRHDLIRNPNEWENPTLEILRVACEHHRGSGWIFLNRGEDL